MKINSTVFTIIIMSLIAAVSYYLGGSMRGRNLVQQATLSTILPTTSKHDPELTQVKWEYGVYSTIKGVCYKWQDSDKSVFSTDIKEFYRKVGLPSNALLQDLLNLMGTQGWELVSVSIEGTKEEPAFSNTYYFKRQK